MNLASLLSARAKQRSDAPALYDRRRGTDRTTTYGQLDETAQAVSAALRDAGVTAGDRVLVLQPMSLELYATILGTLRIGAVIVVPDLSMDRHTLNTSLGRFPCRAFVGPRRAHLLRFLMGGIRRIPIKIVTNGWLPFTTSWPQEMEKVPPSDLPDDHPAVLTFTSGSTGRPKAALRSHGFLLAQEQAIATLVDSGPGDIDLALLPLFVLANLARGVASVLPDANLLRPASLDASRVLAQARTRSVTTIGGPPAALTKLAAAAQREGTPLQSARWIHTGGGPVFPVHLDQLRRLGPNATIVAVYGSTEAEPIAEVSHRDLTARDREETERGGGLLAGHPIKQIHVAILENHWGEPIGPFDPRTFKNAQVAKGKPGEIVVAGKHVLRGYVDPADDRETKFRVGETVWHRTGDGGRIDAKGRLWLLGRCTARIQDQRGELWPLSVEAAARIDPRVENAALVASEGRRILAIVGPAPVDGLRARLAWAILDEVRRVPSLPMDRRHQSKVDYTRLRNQLGVA